MKTLVRAAAAVVATTLALAAQAQGWPTRAVKIIVPFARPDGYTIAMVSTTHVITPSTYRQMPYDALRDFTPVMKLTVN